MFFLLGLKLSDLGLKDSSLGGGFGVFELFRDNGNLGICLFGRLDELREGDFSLIDRDARDRRGKSQKQQAHKKSMTLHGPDSSTRGYVFVGIIGAHASGIGR